MRMLNRFCNPLRNPLLSVNDLRHSRIQATKFLLNVLQYRDKFFGVFIVHGFSP
jgi:hypothetical protein